MCKRLVAAIIAVLISNVICLSPVKAQKGGVSNDEVKAKIARLGTGPKAVVRVTLLDKTKVQGWLSLVTEDHFTITGEKTGAATTIAYTDVRDVKSLKPSHGALIAGGVVVVGVAAAIFLFAGGSH